MHYSLRNVDSALSPDLDLDGLEFPNITIVTVTHLDLPQTQRNEEQNDVTALMLDGFTATRCTRTCALSATTLSAASTTSRA